MSEITPALKLEEWKFTAEISGERSYISATRELIAREALAIADESALPRIVAIANFALPDDDPRKITSADLSALRTAARELPLRYDGDVDPPRDELSAQVATIAAKLAALLPPEGST